MIIARFMTALDDALKLPAALNCLADIEPLAIEIWLLSVPPP